MGRIKKLLSAISRMLDVPSTDPDDARRRKLLNILSLGAALSAALALLVTLVADIAGLERLEGVSAVYLSGLATLVGVLTIIVINRYWSGWLASSLFLLFLTAVLSISDVPQEISNGRSTIVFAVPIVVASVLLRPDASFIMAALSSLVITVIALGVGEVPNPFAMILFLALAIVSWLSARSLERVLRDLRALNRELDQRVVERTRELAETLSKNEAILEGIADGVIVFDNDDEAVVANLAITDLLERSADAIIGHDIKTLMGDDVDTEDRELIISLLRNRDMHYPSLKLEWGDRTLSVSIAPVHVASGEAIGTVAVFRDFTREAELDRMKSAFVAIASHELRTPLSAILGYADMLQAGVHGPLSEKQHSTLERIVANTGTLLNLVSNLLDQAQIEAGTLRLNFTPFTLSDLFDNVQGAMDVLAQSKGLNLSSHIATDMPDTFFGDRQRLYQILINLVGNAIKFTDEGTVLVCAYRFDADHWALEVSDTGSGIPPEAQLYIFEPFRQVDDSSTREYTGAGLGLSIVKQLVDLMGGDITLKSGVGHGSTFTIALPLVPPPLSPSEEHMLRSFVLE